MIPPVEDDKSDIEAMLFSMIEPGHSFEIWSPLEAYEAAAIMLKLLEERKAALEAPPSHEPSSENPD